MVGESHQRYIHFTALLFLRRQESIKTNNLEAEPKGYQAEKNLIFNLMKK
jgi:hypothetical protein